MDYRETYSLICDIRRGIDVQIENVHVLTRDLIAKKKAEYIKKYEFYGEFELQQGLQYQVLLQIIKLFDEINKELNTYDILIKNDKMYK